MEIRNSTNGYTEESTASEEYNFDNHVSLESIWDVILPFERRHLWLQKDKLKSIKYDEKEVILADYFFKHKRDDYILD